MKILYENLKAFDVSDIQLILGIAQEVYSLVNSGKFHTVKIGSQFKCRRRALSDGCMVIKNVVAYMPYENASYQFNNVS